VWAFPRRFSIGVLLRFLAKAMQLEQPQSNTNGAVHGCRAPQPWAIVFELRLVAVPRRLEDDLVRPDHGGTMTQTGAFHLSLSGHRVLVEYDHPATYA
jgi:hypothetical protein